MSDLTSNNPQENSNLDGYNSQNFELITSYIDNQISNSEERASIENLIQTDNNYYNRYIFEKLTKELFKKRIKRIETPVYIYKNIGKSIEKYIHDSSKASSVLNTAPGIDYVSQIKTEKSHLKRNLVYSLLVFSLFIIAAFGLYNYLNKNSEFRENDLVAVSRSVFDKVESGQIKVQHQCSNAKDLADTMDKYLDFKVFIPDVKDAVLIGGACDEINGEKLAHIIHRKGNLLIYTLQACKKDVMSNYDKIILNDKFKGYVNEGKNWFPCLKDKNKTAVVWYKDNVICSTVAAMDSQDIAVILSNYK